MNKKDVRIAEPLVLNSMVKLDYINSDSVATNASKHLSGKRRTIESIADSTGLNCGSLKATTYAKYAECQDTVNQRSRASKTIGSSNRPRKSIIIKMLNMSFTMRHTSTRTGALSIS